MDILSNQSRAGEGKIIWVRKKKELVLFQAIHLLMKYAFSSFSQSKSLKSLEIYGFLNLEGLEILKEELPDIAINQTIYSSIARPVGSKYSGKIWGVLCKD